MNKLLSEENKVPEQCVKLGRQGPPHINKVKQYKLRCPLNFHEVCFSLFGHENKESLTI